MSSEDEFEDCVDHQRATSDNQNSPAQKENAEEESKQIESSKFYVQNITTNRYFHFV